MTEQQAKDDLYRRGIWQLAPGLWCDKNIPDMIAVHCERDNAIEVRAALIKSNMLPAPLDI